VRLGQVVTQHSKGVFLESPKPFFRFSPYHGRDDEVKAEKVVTEAERARRAAKPAADDGASGLQGGASGQDDGKAERALKQMMGGTLVGKQVCGRMTLVKVRV